MIEHNLPVLDGSHSIQCKALPAPFTLEAEGICQEVVTAEGDVTNEWICSPIEVLGTACDRKGTDWGCIVELQDQHGHTHRMFLSNADLATTPSSIIKRLANHGLRIAQGKAAKSAVLDLLNQWRPTRHFRTTRRCGWVDEQCDAFVLDQEEILGDQNTFLLEHELTDRNPFSPSGDVALWRETVGSKCIGNPILVSAVSLAFAAPLLEVLEIEGFGLHLRGGSSSGKSTTQYIAISVWGAPDTLCSWRTTANALESTASATNGKLLALEELALVSGKDAFDAAYALSSGKGKSRANSSGFAPKALTWKVTVLSSGEISLAEKIAEAGQKAMTGQEVRMIDIAADVRTYGVFDELHGAPSGHAFASDLKAASARSYGHCGRAFVEHSIRNKDAIGRMAFVNSLIQGWATKISVTLDGPEMRVARNFATIALAGELATRADLTGWARGEATKSARILFESWLDRHRNDPATGTAASIEKLQAALGACWEVALQKIGGPENSANLGYRDDDFLYLNDAAWDLAFGINERTTAAKRLSDAGVLVRDGAHFKAKAPRSIVGRPRFYKIRRSALHLEPKETSGTALST